MGWWDVAHLGVSRVYGILDWWGMAWTGGTFASDLLCSTLPAPRSAKFTGTSPVAPRHPGDGHGLHSAIVAISAVPDLPRRRTHRRKSVEPCLVLSLSF